MGKAKRLRAQKAMKPSPDPIVNMPGVDAKLRRANMHLDEIERQVKAFAAPNPNHFVHQYDDGRGQVITRPHPSLFAPREDWSTTIGDCVHNLRSALDHLAHDLVTLGGGVPRGGRSGTAFPILDSLVGPNGGPRKLHISTSTGNISPEVFAVIEALQPYNRLNRLDDPLSHPLWVLSELDNMDKHRTLALTGIALNGFGFGINTMRDISLHIATMGGYTGPFDENAELAVWKATVTGPNPQMDMQPRGTIQVALAPPCIMAGEPLIPTLTDLRDYITDIIEILKFIGGKTVMP